MAHKVSSHRYLSFLRAYTPLHALGHEKLIKPLPSVQSWAYMLMLESKVDRAAWLLYGQAHGIKIVDNPLSASHSRAPNLPMCRTPVGKAALWKQVSQRLSDGTVKKWLDIRHLTQDPLASTPRKVSPMFWVPKRGISITDEVREIQHMSAPAGNSVNDMDPPSVFEDDLKFVTTRQAADSLHQHDFMCKEDVRWGYKNLVIHPSCWSLMGFELDGVYYVDTTIPFGLAIAPWVFSQYSGVLKNHIVRLAGKGPRVFCYLDDFLLIAPSAAACGHLQSILHSVFKSVGWVVNTKKTIDPCQVCEFLGVCLDSVNMTLYLSPERVHELHEMISGMLKIHHKTTKKEVQSFCGTLNWAAAVISGGRTFLRSWINAMNKVKHQHHFVHITSEMREDLHVWSHLLTAFNSSSISSSIRCGTIPASHNTTDACTSGLGGFFNGEVWFSNWPPEVTAHINIKELAAAVSQANRFAHLWAGHKVVLGCDNTATVSWINRTAARPPEAMPYIKELFWLATKHDFELQVVHIPGVQNTLADAASRQYHKLIPSLLSTWADTYQPISFHHTAPAA